MPKIFISYRRRDSGSYAARIYDRLVTAFGRDNIFKDVNSIPMGNDFRFALDKALSQCSVQLVIIGPDWLSIEDENGYRRLDNANDFVRLEVTSALMRNDCSIIPILVGGAKMPGPDDIPADLRELAFQQATTVHDDPDFDYSVGKIIQRLSEKGEPDFFTPEQQTVSNITTRLIELPDNTPQFIIVLVEEAFETPFGEEAIFELAQLEHDSVEGILVQALRHPNPKIRPIVLQAMLNNQIAPIVSFDDVLPFLSQDTSWRIADSASKLIILMGVPVLERLRTSLKTENESIIQSRLCKITGQLKNISTPDELVEMLKIPSRNVRVSAIEALGEIGDEKAINALLEVLLEPGDLSQDVDRALVQVGENAVEALFEFAGRADLKEWTRRVVQTTLLNIQKPREVSIEKQVLTALDSENIYLKILAMQLYPNLTGNRTTYNVRVEKLGTFLTDPNETVLHTALIQIRQIIRQHAPTKHNAKAFLSDIENLSTHHNTNIAQQAQACLTLLSS